VCSTIICGTEVLTVPDMTKGCVCLERVTPVTEPLHFSARIF
jgi:hypothetical protein